MTCLGYTVDLARPKDLKEIAAFINTNFFLDVPLIRMFGIEEVPAVLKINDKPDKNTAFIVKAISTKFDIIGAAVSVSKLEEWPITQDTDSNTVQFIDFIHFIDNDSRILTLPEKTVELYILSVASNWRRKGVGRMLGEASITAAKQQGFEMMKICCVNEFTANIARSLGFQEFYKLAYSDYNKSRGVTLRTLPPHNFIYYYVKNLKDTF